MKKNAACLAFVLTLGVPVCTSAGPDRVSFLLGSHHVNAQRDFQEFNPGVFLTWERGLSYSAGAYYNSYKGVSPIVAVGYDVQVARDFDVGAFFAVAVYPGDGDEFKVSAGDVVPLVGLQARYQNVFVQFIPSDGEALDALFAFGLTFDLK